MTGETTRMAEAELLAEVDRLRWENDVGNYFPVRCVCDAAKENP